MVIVWTWFFYFVFFEWWFAGTPGILLLGLRLRGCHNGKITLVIQMSGSKSPDSYCSPHRGRTHSDDSYRVQIGDLRTVVGGDHHFVDSSSFHGICAETLASFTARGGLGGVEFGRR
jgi:hypothetical protein